MSVNQNKANRGKMIKVKEKTEYDDLIIAIIKQAADDYRLALHGGRDRLYQPTVTEIESFFRSTWYSLLTDVDGEMIIKRLKEEVEANDGKKT